MLTPAVIKPLPKGPYSVLFADPPWNFKLYSKKGSGRSPSQHYHTMRLSEIKALDVPAGDDCHLFLWTTPPHLPQAFSVMRAWGFSYSSMGFIWVKLRPGTNRLFTVRGQEPSGKGGDYHIGLGHTTRKNAEFCLLGRKGKPKRLRKDIAELIVAPVREHSRKPEEAYDRVEIYASGPRLEMFSRTDRPGWDTWGAETGKFRR